MNLIEFEINTYISLGNVIVTGAFYPGTKEKHSGHPDTWEPAEPDDAEILKVILQLDGDIKELDIDSLLKEDKKSIIRELLDAGNEQLSDRYEESFDED